MVKIPYKLVGGILLIPAEANGKEGFFAFDTGAMQTAINKAYFSEIRGEHIDIAKFSEGVKEDAAEEGTLNTLRFSDMELSDVPVLIMDLMYVENALKAAMPDLKFLGTLGIDVIRNYTVLLDYNATEIILDPECGIENQAAIPMQLIPTPKSPNIVTVPVVRVGENEYVKIKATISNISAIQKKVPVEGVIGYQILSPQRSVLDFKNHRLILEKEQKN